MDSYVLAEMFKYLYLLFADEEEVEVNVDDYIFTTEAHLLPLTLSVYSRQPNKTNPVVSLLLRKRNIPFFRLLE